MAPQVLWQSPPWWGRLLSSGGKVPGCLDPEKAAASEALWLPPVPEAVSFCSPHSHLCRLVSVESWNQDISRRYLGKAYGWFYKWIFFIFINGYSVFWWTLLLAWHLCHLWFTRPLPRLLWLLDSLLRSQLKVWYDCIYMFLVLQILKLSIFLLFYIFNALVLFGWKSFLFYSNLFDIMQTSCIFRQFFL